MRKFKWTQNRFFSFFFSIASLHEKNIVVNFISLVCASFRMQKSSFFPCRIIESTMQRKNKTNFSHLLNRSFHGKAVILQCYMLDIFTNVKVQVDTRTFFSFFFCYYRFACFLATILFFQEGRRLETKAKCGSVGVGRWRCTHR